MYLNIYSFEMINIRNINYYNNVIILKMLNFEVEALYL